jgi:hypothetical protein
MVTRQPEQARSRADAKFRESRSFRVRTDTPYILEYLGPQPRKDSMSPHLALVLVALLGTLAAPASAYAQLTPPAGSAGAGNSPISGVPFGPANPSALSDPSGIGNAARIPPVGRNPPPLPPPPTVSRSVGSRPSRVVAPYAGASQRIFSADQVGSRRPPVRRHGRPRVSSFTGICRGC